MIETAAAQAQTPDTLCAGVDMMLKGAAEAPPFRTLRSDPRISIRGETMARPFGLEGAYFCTGVVTPNSGRTGFLCLWRTQVGMPEASQTIPMRVKACLLPAGWTATAAEGGGKSSQTFSRSESSVRVTTESIVSPGLRSDSVFVTLPE